MSEQPSATLYAIPGSHACETGALMLEHKGIEYRRVDFWPGVHSLMVRMRGFPGKGQTRMLGDAKPTFSVRMGDRLGTVPALKLGDERLQTNHAIARRLDELDPEPPLFPADPAQRAKVEEAEGWADDPFQMFARRLTLAAVLHGPDALYDRGGKGRLGALLWHNDRMRLHGSRMLAKRVFSANPDTERKMLDELPEQLDRIDGYIADGVLGGERLYAPDYAVASSLAILSYRKDLRPLIDARPAGALVDRVWAERSGPVGRQT
ncbi:MAG: glutathione S-transferase [Solirubrobacterales bacterium]|jgi:glutathione S-transferase|nr:glutathione S-transferase [Solirubrobacterales bacterium]